MLVEHLFKPTPTLKKEDFERGKQIFLLHFKQEIKSNQPSWKKVWLPLSLGIGLSLSILVIVAVKNYQYTDPNSIQHDLDSISIPLDEQSL